MKNLTTAIKTKWIVITLFLVFIFLLCCRVGQTGYTLFDSNHNVSHRLEAFKQAATPFPLVVKWTRSLNLSSSVPLAYQDGLVIFYGRPWQALESETGERVWSQNVSGASLVCQQPDALIIAGNGTFSRVNPQTGKVVWQVETNYWNATCTTNVLVARVPHGLVQAFDIATGHLRWSDINPSNRTFSSHLVYDQKTQEIFGRAKNPDRGIDGYLFYTINPQTGTVIRAMDDPLPSSAINTSSAIYGRWLFVKGGILNLETWQARTPISSHTLKPTFTSEEIYLPTFSDGVWALDPDTLRFRWVYTPQSPIQDGGTRLAALTEMVILDNVGYIILSDATLRAIDLDSGKELGRWQPEDEVLAYWPLDCLNYPLGDYRSANITASEETVIVSFGGNKLYALGRPGLDNSDPTHHHYEDDHGNDQSYSQFSYALALLWSALTDPETSWALFGLILMILGIITSLIGGIWVIVIAFQEDASTGLACIFIPYVAFVYTIKHCRTKTGKPFLLELTGLVLCNVGLYLWLPYQM